MTTTQEKNLMPIHCFKALLLKSKHNSSDFKGTLFKAWRMTLLSWRKHTAYSDDVKITLESCIDNAVYLDTFIAEMLKHLSGYIDLKPSDVSDQIHTWSEIFYDELTMKELYRFLWEGDNVWFETVGHIWNKTEGYTKDKTRFMCDAEVNDAHRLYKNLSLSVAIALDMRYDETSKSVVLGSYGPYDVWRKIGVLLFNNGKAFDIYEQN